MSSCRRKPGAAPDGRPGVATPTIFALICIALDLRLQRAVSMCATTSSAQLLTYRPPPRNQRPHLSPALILHRLQYLRATWHT